MFDTGTRRRRGGITVVSAPPVSSGGAVGFVISRSSGKAVVRNRIKRRLRAAVREIPEFLEQDRVVIATGAIATVPFETLVQWLLAAISHDE